MYSAGSLPIWIAALIVLIFIAIHSHKKANNEKKRVAAMSPEERQQYLDEKKKQLDKKQNQLENMQHGPVNPILICPHCQTAGSVRTRSIKAKKGISGGKATAAILTGGISMLATGLSRKENSTEAYCSHCKSRWNF